jgi:hypothetical protein
MTIEISSTNPRSIAALALTVRAGGWARCRLRDGSKFYGVPSRTRPGLVHLTDTASCSCPDFKYRGQACAHILAVRLHCEQVKAKAALEAKRRGGRTPEPGPRYELINWDGTRYAVVDHAARDERGRPRLVCSGVSFGEARATVDDLNGAAPRHTPEQVAAGSALYAELFSEEG